MMFREILKYLIEFKASLGYKRTLSQKPQNH